MVPVIIDLVFCFLSSGNYLLLLYGLCYLFANLSNIAVNKNNNHPSLSSGPPSAPRNLVSLVNDTALFLQWMPPSDLGGRKDITYNILCQRCDGVASDSGVTQCEPCEPDLRFIPRPLGLTGTSVAILDFAMNANYTFHVEAVNGVSGLGMAARSLVNVTINTHQAGKFKSACSLKICRTSLFLH